MYVVSNGGIYMWLVFDLVLRLANHPRRREAHTDFDSLAGRRRVGQAEVRDKERTDRAGQRQTDQLDYQ